MLKIEGKTFMNLQEAVQWLLDNNALPFQCEANYAPLTEIGLGTIVNPTPAKVRIGSLIFFADSKVSTVVGITETGFIVSDKYNNLVDDVVYVSNVAINASGHLIVTLSNGDNIDAGLIKQVSNFSINASQHLIASFNDGTTTDLGAIFSGNITVSGNLTVTGGISGNAITGDSIIENMSGYSWTKYTNPNITQTDIYVSVVKNGNKLTIVYFGKVNLSVAEGGSIKLGSVTIPNSVGTKLYPFTIGTQTNVLDQRSIALLTSLSSTDEVIARTYKESNTQVALFIRTQDLVVNTDYLFRYEVTFLLSENLAS